VAAVEAAAVEAEAEAAAAAQKPYSVPQPFP